MIFGVEQRGFARLKYDRAGTDFSFRVFCDLGKLFFEVSITL